MSFRQLQKYRGGRFIPVYSNESKTLENGCVVFQPVSQSDKKLPDSKLFDLEYQLKAGVNLEEVNSKVLSHSRIDGDRVMSLISEKNTDKNEVNNEIQ